MSRGRCCRWQGWGRCGRFRRTRRALPGRLCGRGARAPSRRVRARTNSARRWPMCSKTPPGCAVSYGDTRAIFIARAARAASQTLIDMVSSHRATQLSIGADRSGLHRMNPKQASHRLRRTDERLRVHVPIITKAGSLEARFRSLPAGSEIFREVAGHPVPRFELPERRRFERRSARRRMGSACGTGSRRAGERARRIAKDRRACPPQARIGDRRGRKKGAGVRVQWPLVQRAVGARSTITPRYITATSSEICRTTPRSWLMKR